MSLSSNGSAPPPLDTLWRRAREGFVALVYIVGTSLILLLPGLPSRFAYSVSVGEIAPEDIRAPRTLTYISKIETEAARQAAAQSVPDVFDPPDPRKAREQVRTTQQVIDFVRDVRADPLLDSSSRLTYLMAIDHVAMTPEIAQVLVDATEADLAIIEKEATSLIEEALSGTVREGHVEEVTSRLDLKVGLDIPERLIPAILAIARGMIVPNSLLNLAATQELRLENTAAVPEIEHTYQQGEIVVRAGESIDARHIEAMQALGLINTQLSWEDVVSALLASLLGMAIMVVYIVSLSPRWMKKVRNVLLAAILFMLFLFTAQLMVPRQPVLAYLFPAAALALTLRALYGLELASLSSIILAGLIGYMTGGSLELTVFMAASGLLASGILPRGARLNTFFQAGLFAALGGAATLLIFHLPSESDPLVLAQYVVLALINGLLSTGLTLVLLYIIGNLTGIVTSLQLIDLMRPDHPLQRYLQQEALGTYQHTLSVANLVEAATEAINGDSLLARVGTLYHDIGKASNPGFFIENRIEGGANPHDVLNPIASVNIIKAHVQDGIDLARQYRLPQAIVDFIGEHHGTMPIGYFLHQAKEESLPDAGKIDESAFFYSGPIPHTREIAVLMLADGCESAVRASRTASPEEDVVETTVNKIIQHRIDEHQLDQCGLTLRDLTLIRESFVRSLKGMYHPRVRYPDQMHTTRLGDTPVTSNASPGKRPGIGREDVI
jgi:hypothetical protein